MKSNRERVIETMSQLVLEHGVAQASMDAVVSRSGVAKSNIYYHFKSRDELLLAVLTSHMTRLEALFRRTLLDSAVPLAGRLRRYTDGLLAELVERDCVGGCPLLSLVVAAGDANPLLREYLADFFRRQHTALTALLTTAQATGEVRAGLAPAVLASLLTAWLEGSLMLTSISRDPTALRQERDALLHLLAP